MVATLNEISASTTAANRPAPKLTQKKPSALAQFWNRLAKRWRKVFWECLVCGVKTSCRPWDKKIDRKYCLSHQTRESRRCFCGGEYGGLGGKWGPLCQRHVVMALSVKAHLVDREAGVFAMSKLTEGDTITKVSGREIRCTVVKRNPKNPWVRLPNGNKIQRRWSQLQAV